MLEAQKLAARRGFATLFTGLSFRVDDGEALVVSGANGTGKTTLLRIVAGLTTPASGTLTWNGDVVAPLDRNFAVCSLRRSSSGAEGRAFRRGESRASSRSTANP
jgi:ABC-type transport system involved in cytochrome c biogenesis ATPase subunit